MAMLPLQSVCSTHDCCRSHTAAVATCLCRAPACFWSHQCCLCLYSLSVAPLPALACCRSHKAEHLQHNPCAEICIYAHKTSEQFRIRGKLTVIGPGQSDEVGTSSCTRHLSLSTRLGLTGSGLLKLRRCKSHVRTLGQAQPHTLTPKSWLPCCLQALQDERQRQWALQMPLSVRYEGLKSRQAAPPAAALSCLNRSQCPRFRPTPITATACCPFSSILLLHRALCKEAPCVMAVCRKWYASNRPPGQPLQEPDVLLQKDIPSKKVTNY